MKKMCKKLSCAGIFALTSALPAATPIENDFSVNAATKGMTLGKNAAIADGVLDLEDTVRTDVLLELPGKVLCSEDCKGLCCQCGKNLNEGSCTCEKKQIDPRLAVLSQLLD